MAAQSPAKRRKLDPYEQFSVIIGDSEDQHAVVVAKSYLTRSSEFLKKACNGIWQEGQTKTIRLPEADYKIFAIYLQWLYTGEVVVTEIEEPCPGGDFAARDSYTSPIYKDLIDLYLLADMLADTKAQNAAMDELRRYAKCYNVAPGIAEIWTIFENTVATSPLSTFIIDLYAMGVDQQVFAKTDRKYPDDFCRLLLLKLIPAARRQSTLENPFTSLKCIYHQHDALCPPCQ